MEQKTFDADFWNDNEKAQEVLKSINILKGKKDNYLKLKELLDDVKTIIELIMEKSDETLEKKLKKESSKLEKMFDKMNLEMLLSGKYDANNAIISLHPGSGGTESQDWAEMLLRMYTRWAESSGFKVTTLDYLEGDVAGLKSVTLLIEGIYAFGYLKAEKGVHRLVRISPFDSSGRRHTSFASLEVMPEINDDIDIEIDMDDLKIDTYRASGAGGQHVNKTDSAIRITHLPTGIVVQCQNQRSQHQNKETALKMIKSKLYELEQEKKSNELNEIKGEQKEITWGNQIRSYVFHPYNMVKDHRTNYEIGNIQSVMDGNIDDFIDEYLKMIAR